MKSITSSTTAGLGRREFLLRTGLGAASVFFPWVARGNPLGANERIRIGVIGCGGISRGHLALGSHPWVELRALCDVKSDVLAEALAFGRTFNPDCQGFADYGDILSRIDIDAVFVCTPDHWHAAIAIDAMRAGKDVYLEKPMTLTLREAQAVVDAEKRYGRIVQVGSQQRSDASFRRAAEIVRNGWIGKVREVYCQLGEFAPESLLPEEPVPPTIDYDRWLGPAPWQPYNAVRVLGNFGGGWRIFRDYGSRMNGDMGAHHFDIVQWALGMDASGPVLFVPQGYDGAPEQYHEYANGTRVKRVSPGVGRFMIRFVGEEGEVGVSRGDILETTPASLAGRAPQSGDIRLYQSSEHRLNWLECIRTRRPPICPATVGQRTFDICGLSAIAEQLGRPLRWDPSLRQIVDDPAATRFADTPRRAGYPLPS
jgi:predicted dehydrogenase